jgi:hypothetical protein
MKNNINNFDVYRHFTDIAKELNNNNVTPIIYGSLGLSLLISYPSKINDMDFLISSEEEFSICSSISEKQGFVFDPEHDREFEGNGTFVSFLNQKDIEDLIGHKLKLKLSQLDGAKFYNLSLEDYLNIYETGLRNKWRRRKKIKSDNKLIELIREEFAKS